MPPKKLILSINAGSSSLKLSLYSAVHHDPHPKLVLASSVSGLTSPPAVFSYIHASNPLPATTVKSKQLPEVNSQDNAFEYFLGYLFNDTEVAGIGGGEDIAFVCHRVVHGGDYEKPVLISGNTLPYLKEFTSLAPLHNAPALSLIHTALTRLPATKNIAFFDTSFHTISLPEHAKTYPVDYDIARSNKIRKYGFHGISYQFIRREVAGFLNKPVEKTSIIALHLGSGASACAIKNGQSIDTSMGLTPLEGLPGATRAGSIDPSLIFHYTSSASSPANSAGAQVTKAEGILNKSMGWSALTSTSDFSKLVPSAPSPRPPRAGLAFDMFVDKVAGYVAWYYVKLGGEVDALVFAGGIGEGSGDVRGAVVRAVGCLGFEVDEGVNEAAGRVGGAVARVGKNVLVCRSDEQMEMVRGCVLDDRFWES